MFKLFICVLVINSVLSLPRNEQNIDEGVNDIMKNNRQTKSIFTNLSNMMKNQTNNIFSKNKNKNRDCSKCFPGQGPSSVCDIPVPPSTMPPNTPGAPITAWRDVLHCAPGGVFYGSECIFNCRRLCEPNLPVPTSCGDHLADPLGTPINEGLTICSIPAVQGSCSGDLQVGVITGTG